MNQDLMFSSAKDDWETPQKFFDKLNDEFKFTLDVCALPTNAKCFRYFTPEQNGLSKQWNGEVCWMNPPYGRESTGKWIQKAYEESLRGTIVVCLIPARTDTKSWHEYCMKADEIRLIKGRLRFGGVKNAAPFPSAVVIFKPNTDKLKVSTYFA